MAREVFLKHIATATLFI